jgi:hypothetical protein
MTSASNQTWRVAMSALALGIAAAATACSPALNWREFVPEDSGLSMTFPCRPDRHARAVTLAGSPVKMEMLACSAADVTFAVSFVDLTDPARVSAVLAEWRLVTMSNVQGVAGATTPVRVVGMTPNDQAVLVTVDGKLPDGAPVHEQSAFFVRGLRLYSASVVGAKLDPSAAGTFFGGLKFPG